MVSLSNLLPLSVCVPPALDEISNTCGIPSLREKVLVFLEELVDLQLQISTFCITVRHEVDITSVLYPTPFLTVLLHDKRAELINSVRSVVYSYPNMKKWNPEDEYACEKSRRNVRHEYPGSRSCTFHPFFERILTSTRLTEPRTCVSFFRPTFSLIMVPQDC